MIFFLQNDVRSLGRPERVQEKHELWIFITEFSVIAFWSLQSRNGSVHGGVNTNPMPRSAAVAIFLWSSSLLRDPFGSRTAEAKPVQPVVCCDCAHIALSRWISGALCKAESFSTCALSLARPGCQNRTMALPRALHFQFLILSPLLATHETSSHYLNMALKLKHIKVLAEPKPDAKMMRWMSVERAARELSETRKILRMLERKPRAELRPSSEFCIIDIIIHQLIASSIKTMR